MTDRIVAFDTNLVLRWILQDVPVQSEQVITILKDPAIKEVHIADMVLAEVVWVLTAPRLGYGRKDAVELLNIVFRYPKVRYNKALMNVALPFYVSHSGVSFVDSCLASYAQLGGYQLLTFDRKLSRQSKHAKLV